MPSGKEILNPRIVKTESDIAATLLSTRRVPKANNRLGAPRAALIAIETGKVYLGERGQSHRRMLKAVGEPSVPGILWGENGTRTLYVKDQGTLPNTQKEELEKVYSTVIFERDIPDPIPSSSDPSFV